MESLTPVTDPQPITPPAPVDPVIVPSAKKPSPLLLSLLLLTVIAIAIFFVFRSYQRLNSDQTASQSSSPSVVGVPTSSSPLPVIEGSATKLAYLRDPNPEIAGDNELWLIDAITGSETKLPLQHVFNVYKHLNSPKLFYTAGENNGSVHVYDLSQGTDLEYKLISHPDIAAKTSITISSIDSISPSGDYLVFQAGFYKDCPAMSPLPTGFEGGFGPCMPDESLETPTGNYLYDFKSSKATPVTELFRVSRWDEASHKLYYITDHTTKSLDLTAKTVTNYDFTQSFGYFVYPLLKSNSYVKNEGDTQMGTRIYLTNADGKDLGEIEGYAPWATLQPFIQASPDEKNIIYVKTVLDGQGIRVKHLRKFDLAKKTSMAVTPDDKQSSYSSYLSWLDNDTFITTEEIIESPKYIGGNNNLVKINITNGQLTPLTTHSKVYQFNMQ